MCNSFCNKNQLLDKAVIPTKEKMDSTIASHTEYTLLQPGTTLKEIEQLCKKAIENNVAAVCLPPLLVEKAKSFTSGSGVRTAAGNPKINTGTSSYNNSNSSSRGGVLRDIFSGGSNSSSSGSSNNSSSSPRTSSSSSSSPSSSGSSGGGGSAPVRKF